MFTSKQVITATTLIRDFRRLALLLRAQQQPLLITQKGKDPLVLVSAEIFEELLEFRCQATNAGFQPILSWEDEDTI